jgi:vacuolar-type H+-ATPase subunit H
MVPSGIRAEPPSPVSKSKIYSTSSTESNSLALEDSSDAPIGSQTTEDPDLLVSAKEEADNIIVQARAEAARVQHEADVHASSVLRKAFGEVELMIERAHERASEIVNKAESKMREKNESLASMEQDVAKEVKARLDRADADVARLIANAKSNAADILKVARIQAESLINGSDNNKETLLLSSKR